MTIHVERKDPSVEYTGALLPGVPVATVAIGGAKNAGLLAVQILSVADPSLLQKMVAYKADLIDKVAAMDTRVQKAVSEL